ncbi:MAG: O-antigen ligase family protein, partial [Oscillospiraceae bacterium]
AFMLVFIPVMLLKKEWASRGLRAVGFLGLGVFFKLSVSYRYVEAEQKTYTEFSVSALCIAVLAAAILLIAAGFLTDGKIGKYNGKIIAVSAVLLEIGVIAAAVIYLAFFYNVEAGSGLMAEIAAFLQGKLTLHSGSRRVAIWKYSFEMGMERPLLGHGTGVFKQAFSISKGADYAKVSSRALDMAHNDYLQIFCESGLIGLAAYLGYLATTFFRAVKAAVKNTNVLVLMIAAMCYLVQIFFSFNIVIVVPVFWVVMGLLENETVKSKKSEQQK